MTQTRSRLARWIISTHGAMFCATVLVVGCAEKPQQASEPDANPSLPFVVTQGVGKTISECPPAADCRGGGRTREVHCGEITDDEGYVWPLPGPVSDGSPAVDLFDDCIGEGHNPDYETQLVTQVIDDEGSEITAYLFGDNYFELYVNGEFAGRDAVGFTPFNSHVARYQVEYPITYAALLIDWEGYLGVGLEDWGEGKIHIGDGGFIARFSDGTATDGTWRCRTFYVAPLDDPSCLVVDAESNPDSSGCPSTDDSVACISNDFMNTCRAAHFPLPEDWMSPEYDDSGWSPAVTYTADDVTGAPGFRNYEDTLFQGAEFIWSTGLELDNLVICRATVESPPG